METEQPPQDRIAAMDGAGGDELQFRMIMERSMELIDQRFDYFSFLPGKGTAVRGNNTPYIQLRDN